MKSIVAGCDTVGENNQIVEYNKPINPTLQMWAMYGSKHSLCERALSHLNAGQYTIDWSDTLGVHFNKKQ